MEAALAGDDDAFAAFALRRKNRNEAFLSVDAMLESGCEPSVPEAPVPHPDLERLHATLAQLSPKERLVIALLELEERSVQEAAGLTGWSLANMKIRAFRPATPATNSGAGSSP